MRPDVRLVVTDLDGTLLTTRKTVSAVSVSALSDARAAGLQLAVASARPYRLVQDVLPAPVLALFDAVIVSNGAAVIRPLDDSVLHESTLRRAASAFSIETLRATWPTAGFGWESGTEFSSDDVLLRLAGAGTILRDPHPDRVLPLPAGPVHQLVMAVPGAAPRSLLASTAAILGPEYTVTDSLGGVVEISPAGVSKASAADWWARSTGATLADVVAFGDEHNDLPLLRAAGIGVAMANARDEVRAAAASTTLTNDQDGVAVALRALLSGHRSVEKDA
ncbi:MAG: HAD hydrolase family protein [Herbiconiux sp.]|nr:HAD hydrolase family protein [Herbiconiux sp.]